MKTALFYYTGTGNSLWVARVLAERLGDAAITPISLMTGPPDGGAEAIGIIFPVHMWGLPRKVISFVDSLACDPSPYCFAVAVNAGQVAATLLQMKKLMRSKGLTLSTGFSIAMPSNYLPWGGPGPEAKRVERFAAAKEKLGTIARAVAAREESPLERGALWQNILLSGLNRLAFPHVPGMDKSFWVDEKCNGCGICKAVCPCGNIELLAGKPVWQHHCEQCLACIQWCPQEAIQFGKKTPRYERYHHPEITLQDMLGERKNLINRTNQ